MIHVTLKEEISISERELELLRGIDQEQAVSVYTTRISSRDFMGTEVCKIREEVVKRKELESLVKKGLLRIHNDSNHGDETIFISSKGLDVLEVIEKQNQRE